MNERLFLALGILALIYLVWRFLPRKGSQTLQKRDRIDEILNSEEFKVKGQYD